MEYKSGISGVVTYGNFHNDWETIEKFKNMQIRRHHINDYKKFLKTSGYLLPKCISPTKFNDLCWHTHMLCIANYCHECKYFAKGHIFGHDDINFKQKKLYIILNMINK